MLTNEQMVTKVKREIEKLSRKTANKRCSRDNRVFALEKMVALDWVLKEVLKP